MKKRVLLVLSILVLITVIFWFKQRENFSSLFAETDETVNVDDQTLEITSIRDYLEFAKEVENGNTFENWEIELNADLNFQDYRDLKPVGIQEDKDPIVFKGVFDGNGFLISNMHMNNPDGYAGMFACLGGVVKNLQMRDSSFVGKKCGAIAVNTEDAAIYNCFVDALVEGERVGTIVSLLSGDIVNCVVSEGELYEALRKGGEQLCYIKEDCNAYLLNQNLMYTSDFFSDTLLDRWIDAQNSVMLTNENTDLVQSILVTINASGKKLELQGYFSRSQEKWCVALPATYLNKELYVEVFLDTGKTLYLTKMPEESEVLIDLGYTSYPVSFLSAENMDTLYISLANQKDLAYVHENKYEEIPGIITVLEKDGTVGYSVLQGFYGHGNDSWHADKKSYNLKFDTYVDLLGMGANEDFALLAGCRRNSLMSYVVSYELIKEVGFDYAPEFRLVNLYVSGEYVGVYLLAEKMKIDRNRIDITNVYQKTLMENARSLETYEYQKEFTKNSSEQKYYYAGINNPKDITGGYLLEVDNEDYGPYDSRFVTSRNICVVLKRAMYSSKEQVAYISSFWQDFEDALYSENGINSKGKHYTEYIDMESFAKQWLMYELEQEISLNSSIYYYKESDVDGDGLIHACHPWDMEHSYVLSEFNEQVWHTGENSDALEGFWNMLYMHEDFKAEVARIWKQVFLPAVEKMLWDEPTGMDGELKNLNWYRQNIVDMHHMENSRWLSLYPWDKLLTIEEFLRIRVETLSELL